MRLCALLITIVLNAIGLRSATIDSQSAANMVATCSTGTKSLPLSAANFGHPQIEIINARERLFLTCLWVGDRSCARDFLEKLKSMGFSTHHTSQHPTGLNNNQRHSESYLWLYEAEVNAMPKDQAIEDIPINLDGAHLGSRREMLSALEAEDRIRAASIIKSLEEMPQVTQSTREIYQFVYLLYRFPSTIYCPYSEKVLLRGASQAEDLAILEQVSDLSGRDHQQLLMAMEPIKNSNDLLLLANNMYLHWAANHPRIASKYAKHILLLPSTLINDASHDVNLWKSLWRDALSIRAASFLCEEIPSQDQTHFGKTINLIKEYTRRFDEDASFTRSMKSLAHLKVRWSDAHKRAMEDWKQGKPLAPAIKNIPVMPYALLGRQVFSTKFNYNNELES